MLKLDKEILEINKVICRNISKFDDSERGLLSQNILSQLRNFVEYISLKVYSKGNDDINYDNIVRATSYVSTQGNLKFLTKFHKFLQIVASHYTLAEEGSERLMLKYYEYLLRVKSFLDRNYNLPVLENIEEFPLTIDSALKEYYEKIANRIEETRSKNTYEDRYYIKKIKPFFVKHEVYYEVTFTIANDRASKFDRIIAFTKLDISSNYAVKLTINNNYINILGKTMPIQIIDDWEISIRPCELDHFADIFGKHPKIQGGTIEYHELMAFLKNTGLNLVEISNLPDIHYQQFKEIITRKTKTTYFLSSLDKSRELILNKHPGNNIIRYLLYRLTNKVIKRQYTIEPTEILSGLHLRVGCIPFDQMPLTTSLINHNPKLSDLFECIDAVGREHELLARHIKNNIEIKGQLYTPKKDITGFSNIEDLVQAYNRKIKVPVARPQGIKGMQEFILV